MGATEFSFHQSHHQIGLHIGELLLLLAEEQTACMLSRVAKTVTCMTQVFDLTVYEFSDLGVSLSFVNPYVGMNIQIIHEQPSKPLSDSTPFGESI